MKKLLAFLLVLSMMVLFMACTAESKPETLPEAEQSTEPEPGSKTVGISMPREDLQRWKDDGCLMEKQLTEAGYEVQLRFADNDPETQISQLKQMIAAGAKVLVISPIDGDALEPVLEQAKEAGCTIISYDRLIMGSDAVDYYLTFDLYQIGLLQGKFIEEQLDLPNAGDRTYTIEFITGDPGDGNLPLYYNGAMEVLIHYIEDGTLIVPSGLYYNMDVATEGWDPAKAQMRFEELLKCEYTDKPLDAVLATNDSLAQGVAAALETSYSNEIYPIITGADCDILSVRNILEGKQAMSVLQLPSDLAQKAVEMCIAILNGKEPEINNTEMYDNGTGVIPAYLCPLRVCTKDNYKELLLDSGYYSQKTFEDITSYITGPLGTAKVSQFVKYQVKDDQIMITGLSDEGKQQTTLEIPSTIDGQPVTVIQAEAFSNCLNLTGVSIPEGVANIGSRAFFNCTNLTDITIPETVETIGSEAFSNCKMLTDIHIPKGVTAIEGFNHCTSLTDVVIPEGVTRIEGFQNCTGLRSITIPQGVTSIRGFENCTSLSSITIPQGVTSIRGFDGCTGLRNITLPKGMTAIHGFNDCTSLETVDLPDSLRSLEGFSGCTSLTEIRLPNHLTVIGTTTLNDCTSLKHIDLPDSITDINGLSGCSGLSSITIPEGVKNIGSHGFTDCTNLKSIDFPDSISQIEGFTGCAGLTKVTLPKHLEFLGYHAFYSCDNLSSIEFSDSLREIEGFHDCESLIHITIPQGVTKIDGFDFCLNLRSITIPDSVTSISGLLGCFELADVYYAGTKAQWEQIDFSLRNQSDGQTNASAFMGERLLDQDLTIHYNCKEPPLDSGY